MPGRNIKAGAAYIELYVNNSRLVRGLAQAKRRLLTLGNTIDAVGKKLVQFSAIAAAPFAISAKTFSSFEDAMLGVKAVTKGISAEGFRKLTEQAKELGRTTSFTAKEVAESMFALGRAGLSTAEIFASIPGVLNLARATSTDLGQAAQFATDTMRAFGLQATDMTRIVDVLTSTANNSSQSLEDIGEALRYVAPIARAAGGNLEDTAAAIALLANNGIRGSRAGTALARAYKNLAKEDIASYLKTNFEIEVSDERGNLRSIADIISEIGQKIKGLGTQKKIAIFDKIFGRGAVASLSLVNNQVFQNLSKTIRNSGGEAAKTAKIMDSGLGGAFRKLLSATEGIQIALGEVTKKTIAGFANALTRVSGTITQLIKNNSEFLNSFLKGVAITGLVGAGLISLGLVVKSVAAVFGVLSTAVALFTGTITALASLLVFLTTPFGLVVGLVVGLGTAFGKTQSLVGAGVGVIGRAFKFLSKTVTNIFDGIVNALKAGDMELAAKILFAGLEVIFERGKLALMNVFSDIKAFAFAIFNEMARTVEQVFDNMINYVAEKLNRAKQFTVDLVSSPVGAVGELFKKGAQALSGKRKSAEDFARGIAEDVFKTPPYDFGRRQRRDAARRVERREELRKERERKKREAGFLRAQERLQNLRELAGKKAQQDTAQSVPKQKPKQKPKPEAPEKKPLKPDTPATGIAAVFGIESIIGAIKNSVANIKTSTAFATAGGFGALSLSGLQATASVPEIQTAKNTAQMVALQKVTNSKLDKAGVTFG